ncbi:MAG: hypothetical protein CVU89_07570 [Firmicutes bacterium HGW-Firmicutes-14]|jgi:tetratricopeptide (TPR) repeat protein|nr:MAG: hypothetical protein CVU89_07570 [Firmicutes bacterium HGW-Firmicutes-14]
MAELTKRQKTGIFLFAVLMIFFVAADSGSTRIRAFRDNLTRHFAVRQIELSGLAGEDALNLGWTCFNLGEYEKCQELMRRVQGKENHVSAEYCLGLVELQRGRYRAGANRLETVRDNSPLYVPVLINLGKAYIRLEDYGKAKDRLAEALVIEPGNQEAVEQLEKIKRKEF